MTVKEKAAQLQNTAPADPAAGVPAYDWWNEALHGVARTGYATVFPQAIGLAATWDADLLHRSATLSRPRPRQVSTTTQARQASTATRPDLLVAQHQHLPRSALGPRPGDLWRGSVSHRHARRRVHPRAAGRRSRNTSKRSPRPSISRCIAARRPSATASTSIRSPQDLRDTYLPAFRAAVTEGKADSLMCAYNASMACRPARCRSLLIDAAARRLGLHGLHRLGLRRGRRHLSVPP